MVLVGKPSLDFDRSGLALARVRAGRQALGSGRPDCRQPRAPHSLHRPLQRLWMRLRMQGAPLCFYICSLLVKGDRAAQYWIVVLSTGELYGARTSSAPR